ncbi:VWA domain-containing protein [uncultured Azohydromonas sp.]|uniref:VWA domain-containing protein n=1 Tax=uncultured Azohydromonas sp. TaxID=487342 RepID=UPI002635B2DF|nr:VWA domain-containing protein [uncultured Azohydromonas sp.]
MAEAEDVLVDAARHAVAWVQARRVRAPDAAQGLAELAPRLDLLLRAVHGRPFPLRVAQPGVPPTLLARWWRGEVQRPALPGTDGTRLWLPPALPGVPEDAIPALYRAMALQQAARAQRGSPQRAAALLPAERDAFLLLETLAVEAALLHALPGLSGPLQALRDAALARRPQPQALAEAFQRLEHTLRARWQAPLSAAVAPAPAELVSEARALVAGQPGARLHADWWSGEWRMPEPGASGMAACASAQHEEDGDGPPRSAQLRRRPRVRQAQEGEDDASPGAWMVQTAQPQEKAEDPAGLQRPADRDTQEPAQSHAESLAELDAARLVRTPQRAQEVLLSDDPVPATPAQALPRRTPAHGEAQRFEYPEWDHRQQAYRRPGTTVWVRAAEPGSRGWVERTLREQHALLQGLVRRFELLRSRRVTLRAQAEGDEVDLDALVQARADFRAGLPLSERVYRSQRLLRRDMACVVLVDISGSTDGWLAGSRRVIDVEREALLLLALALQRLGEPHALMAFSGRGSHRVTLWQLKGFEEPSSEAVLARIAGLEPQHCTRTGAALRHASWLLSQRAEHHRLLLLLSDGKPQDDGGYEGAAAVQDLRRAVLEARAQGQHPFALTVERQAADWMPRVFPPGHWALLQQPERLPLLVLQWLRRLLMAP